MGTSGNFLLLLFVGMVLAAFLSWYLASADKLMMSFLPRGKELEERRREHAELLRELQTIDLRLVQQRDRLAQLEWNEDNGKFELDKLKGQAASVSNPQNNIVYEHGLLDDKAKGLLLKVSGPGSIYPFNGPSSLPAGDDMRIISVLHWSHDSQVTLPALLRWRNLNLQLLDSRPWQFPSDQSPGQGQSS